jgi:hypothetical protein
MTISDASIIRQSLLRKIEIPWNQVTKVEINTPMFEDIGIRINSRSGEKIVVTELLRGFGVFCEEVRRYVPEQIEANRQLAPTPGALDSLLTSPSPMPSQNHS